MDAWPAGDRELFLLLHGLLNQVLPPAAWRAVTWLGHGAVAVPLFLAWLVWRERHAWRARVRAALLSLLLGGAAVQSLKPLTDRPRPRQAVLAAPGQTPAHHGRSFPSGHAALALGCAVLVLAWRRRDGAAALSVALLVGLSRVAVAAHYPLDVAAGWLFGGGGALLGLHLARTLPRPPPEDSLPPAAS